MPNTRPTFPCEGGCACGAVRYRLLEMPLELHACHCTDCQRLTGGAFAMSMPIRRSALELLRGEPVAHSFKTPEGIAKCNVCCPGCGSRLWGEHPRYPDLLILRPGTLDDPSWAEPTTHIWTRSTQPWLSIPENALRYEQQTDDPTDMVRAWQRRWRE